MMTRNHYRILRLSILTACFLSPAAPAQNPAISERSGHWLILPPVGGGGRAAFHTDAVEAAIVAGTWMPPQAGETVSLPDSRENTWEPLTPGEAGQLRDRALNGGYACWIFESDTERVLLLDASGHSMVYANGSPRIGDVYGTDWVLLPVRVQAGTNVFLFRVARGALRATLAEPPANVCFSSRSVASPVEAQDDSPTDQAGESRPERAPRDLTAPDLIRGESEPVWAALPVLNATNEFRKELAIRAAYPDGRSLKTLLPAIPPLGIRKVGFRLPAAPDGATEELRVTLALIEIRDGVERELDSIGMTVAVRSALDKHKRTFISEIDGSVQYFGVTPAHPTEDERADALFLSLHGAGVEAAGQAAAYEHKTWGTLVAPTNRRPFGFDWEDWGRIDALEVLEIAERMFKPDPRRIYLTGHSMGGHGVWQLAVNFPDRFAAIGPAASWPDFWSYAGAADYEQGSPIEQILARAVAPSRTMQLIRNCKMHGVYILHGDADETVPVDLARRMRGSLAEFHSDFAYYEYPGGGHWWGNSCMDWPPMFDFFKNHVRARTSDVRRVEFHTLNPAVSHRAHWTSIEAQLRQHEPSSIVTELNPGQRLFTAETKNVARFTIDLRDLSKRESSASSEAASEMGEPVLKAGEPLSVRLDEQLLENIPWPEGQALLWFRRDDAHWTVVSRPSPQEKNPRRYGPFKHAFDHRVLLVYGTHGTTDLNRILLEKARFDAETFWYRGNGSVEMIPDEEFDPAREKDRGVILYGNAENNSAWAALLGDSPVQVKNGVIHIGQRSWAGEDLACLFALPRPGSDLALVGAISGTGAPALRATERLPLFLSGTAFPDCVIFSADVLTVGTNAIRAAGFFGIDWGVDSGDFAWRELPDSK